jgi:hypothetical protein
MKGLPTELKGDDLAAFLKKVAMVHSMITDGKSDEAQRRYPQAFECADNYKDTDRATFMDMITEELDKVVL